MPAVSRKQQIAMQIAEHAPDKLYARNQGLTKMSQGQLHDFASGSEAGKPEYAPKPPKSTKQRMFKKKY